MNRVEILHTLKRVAPALSSKDLVPALSHLCFAKGKVVAYDDVVGLEAPCTSSFGNRGLKGSLLINFLAASRGQDVEVLEASPDELEIKCGRARLKVPTISTDDFVFEMPDTAGAVPIIVESDSFIRALRLVSLSIGLDPSHPWRMGVTLEVSGKNEVTLYSSNNVAVSRATASVVVPKTSTGDVIVLPPRWVELATTLAKGEALKSLHYSHDGGWVIATFGASTRLFARVIGEPDVEKFTSTLNFALPDDGIEVEKPKGFEGVLDRALVVLDGEKDKHFEVTVAGGKMRFAANAAAGEFRDSVRSGDHPDAKITCSPVLVKRAITDTTHIRIVGGVCVYMSASDFDHIISAVE